MKRTILVLAVLGTAVGALTMGASAAAKSATLTIRHQEPGCHSWSLNGSAYKVVQKFRLAKGGSLTITNNDVMPHRIVTTSGPAKIHVKLIKAGVLGKGMMKGPFPQGMMGRMGATVKVTFPAKGVYRLMTKFGEDYVSMGDDEGEDEAPDNVLRAIVTVS